MNPKKISLLSIALVLLVWINAGVGLFYDNHGQPRYVENIHGDIVQLFGSGVYANNSAFSATIAKGTDLVMLFIALGLLITALNRSKGEKTKLIHAGLLISLLYYSITKAFEVVFNQMFLLYLIMFSFAFFAFVFTMIDLTNTIRPINSTGGHRKTAIFTMLTGCTVLVWLMDILPAVFTGIPPDFISIYTTSPTVIIDIGLLFPVCIMSGVWLLQKRDIGYVLPPIMLTFLSVIAVTVLGQTAVQIIYGVHLPIHQLVGYVGTFVIFGIIAVIVNIRFMIKCWPKKVTGK